VTVIQLWPTLEVEATGISGKKQEQEQEHKQAEEEEEEVEQ
jgi:hypothetical protein